MIQRLVVPSLLTFLALAGSPAWGAEPTTAERPITALPYTPSLDPSVMDRSVDPCADLFKFSCGKWLDKNPIPADRPRWSVYAKMEEDNERFLWGLLEEAARPSSVRDANTQKIGDYFAACMDEPAIEKAGLAPLRPELTAIAGLNPGPGCPP
jgi:endothelin-converting enzyme/putative endopeptidase